MFGTTIPVHRVYCVSDVCIVSAESILDNFMTLPKDVSKLNRSLLDSLGTVLIDDWDATSNQGSTYIFTKPQQIISATSASDLRNALEKIADLQSQGHYLAGYISYDAGLALDVAVTTRHEQNVPLLWFGVYESITKMDYADSIIHVCEDVGMVRDERLNVSDEEYLRSVACIKEYIAAGDIYQVNYACKLLFRNTGTALGLFARLRSAHPVCHSAFIDTGEFQVMSLSPELFLRATGPNIQTRPMKGTIRRGRSFLEDLHLAEILQQDEKNRAENVMIVDLMRNDIGRVSNFGSVSAPKLFHIEKYRSLLQMTSEVEGVRRNGLSAADILACVLPPGSVTGAPKIRAIRIIDQLENSSRGVYCGCIGMFLPGGDFLLNVAIRTIIQRNGYCELGLGSGIVADSDPQSELQEAQLKGTFLKMAPVDFQLLETLVYQKKGGYLFLDEHLERMERSACFFGWKFDPQSARSSLITMAEEHIAPELKEERARVRLLVSIQGEAIVEWAPIETVENQPVKLLLASRRTNPDEVFLYHKTTNREASDEDLGKARKAGYYDVLYMNQRNELTECATTNIMVEIGSTWYTPPVSCGLLPGIWRDTAVSQGRVTERILTLDDLTHATRIVICNSVRGEIGVDSVDVNSGQETTQFFWPNKRQS